MEMVIAGSGLVSTEAVRAYIKTLREGRYTQKTLALAIGYAYSTYRDWEQGERQGTDLDMIVRVFDKLDAPLDDLRLLTVEGADITTGTEVARNRLQENARIQAELNRITSDATPDQMQRAFATFRHEYERRPSFLARFEDWMSGWKARDED